MEEIIMELIMESTNIFEEKCIIQFDELVRQNFCSYKKEVPHSVGIYFHIQRAENTDLIYYEYKI